ncbi:MAG: DEAD/DEAH box helicase [Methylobacter sp.]
MTQKEQKIQVPLRYYQKEAILKLRSAVARDIKKIILQMATGAGKTQIIAEIIRSANEKGRPVLLLTHRREIISQTSAKLDSFNIDHGVIMSDHPRYKPKLPVQLAAIQTLNNRHKPDADIVIVDEAHISVSASFLKIFEHYKDAIIIGMTATPIRLDGKGLGAIYQDIIEVVPMSVLIEEGYLVKPRVFAPFTPDMSGVKTVRGDYDQHAIAELMDKSSITGDIIEHWQKYAKDRMTIVFASSIAHSQHIVEAFNAAGISARHVDGTTTTRLRDSILADFKNKKFKVLSNMGLYIEGMDAPETSCVILARPTQSLTIYLQSAGRGLRPYPGKSDCVILDHSALTHRHGLIDEPRQWFLDGKKKGNRKAGNDEAAPTVTICESCFAAFSRQEFPDICPQCGEPLPKRKQAVAEVRADGELVELTAEHMERIKARRKQELKSAKTKEQLIELGRSRGYKNPEAWARHRLEERQQWRNRAYG